MKRVMPECFRWRLTLLPQPATQGIGRLQDPIHYLPHFSFSSRVDGIQPQEIDIIMRLSISKH